MTSDFDRRSRSLWMDIAVAPAASTLTGDQTCDTVIVGAGMAGISTAYELSTQGQKVIVIDRGGNRLRANIESDAASVVLTIGVQFDATLTKSSLRPVRPYDGRYQSNANSLDQENPGHQSG